MELLIFFLFIIYLVIQVPVKIAKCRGINGSELTTISTLSWVSIIFIITWFIALTLALIWKPNNWVDKNYLIKSNQLDDLEKLDNLKKKGIITEDEFNEHKNRILNSNF